VNDDKPKKEPPITAAEAGKLGGAKVSKLYGHEFFVAIGKKGGEATKATYGREFYEAIGNKGGKKGGDATRDKYGPTFYEAIGSKGGAKVKAMMEAGKKALAAEAKEAKEEKP
jgi:general stress protein YciG